MIIWDDNLKKYLVIKWINGRQSKLNLPNLTMLFLIILLFTAIIVYSIPSKITESNGVYNIESENNEWHIQNGTIIGWCPLNNCSSIDNSWYSGKLRLFFRITQNKTIIGEELNWSCVDSVVPDNLPENESWGNITQINCSSYAEPLNNPIKISVIYTFHNKSIRADQKIYIENIGNATYTIVKFIWLLNSHNLNNGIENDYVYTENNSFILENAGNGEYEETLDVEGNYYELVFKEQNETSKKLIGSQLFGTNYTKNSENKVLNDIELKISTYNNNMTNVIVTSDFGNLEPNDVVVYEGLSGGDAGSPTGFQLFEATISDVHLSMTDRIVRSSDGRIHIVGMKTGIGNTFYYCNSTNSSAVSFGCKTLYSLTPVPNSPGLAIDSNNTLYTLFTTSLGINLTYSNDYMATWNSIIIPGSSGKGVQKPSIFVDREDGVHIVALNQSSIVLEQWNGYYWYANNGTNFTNIQTFDSPSSIGALAIPYCDGEVDSKQMVHIVCAWLHDFHYNFTVSTAVSNITAQKTQMSVDNVGLEMEVSINHDDKIIAGGRSGTYYILFNSTDSSNGITWNEQYVPYGGTVATSTTIFGWDNAYHRIVEYDWNTDDFILVYSNSTNYGVGWNANVTLQDSASNTDDFEEHNFRGSNYPAFNRVGNRVDYVYLFDDADDRDYQYYSNLAVGYTDIYAPEYRYMLDNSTNATLKANDQFWASIECFDDSNISNIIFSIDDGVGSFTNYSISNYSSPQYYQKDNITYTITAGELATVRWKWYCNDTKGNFLETPVDEFVTYFYDFGILYPPSKGMIVWVRDDDDQKMRYALFNGSNYTSPQDIPDLPAHGVLNINLETSHIKNETSLLTQQGNYEIAVQFYNGSDWYKQIILIPYAGIWWSTSDSCYRKNGDLIIVSSNYTSAGGSPTKRFAYWVWDGVELSNYTGSNFSTGYVNKVSVECSKNSDYAIILYYKYNSNYIWFLNIAVLDNNNNLINVTSLDREHAYDDKATTYNVHSSDGGWLKNGTGVVCYQNYTAPLESRTCLFWSPEQKSWSKPLIWNDDSASVKQGKLKTSYNNNTFMYSTIDFYNHLRYHYFNGSTISKYDQILGTDYHPYFQSLFAFVNTTNNDGVFSYFDYSSNPDRNIYRRWDGLQESLGTEQSFPKDEGQMNFVYSDDYSQYAIINYVANDYKIMSYLYNISTNTSTLIKNVSLGRWGYPYYYYHDFVFFPSSYQAPDTMNPYWSDNKTPTGNLKKNTITNLEVKLNDDTTGSGYYIFATNNTGAWVNDSEVVWNPNEVVIKSLTIQQNKSRNICYYWWFNDSTNKENVTDTWCFTVNNTVPTYTPYFPVTSNPYVVVNEDQNFTINCNDVDEDTTTAVWYVNSTINASGSPCINLTANWTSTANINYNITVFVNDDEGNATKTWILYVRDPPSCDNPGWNFPETPATYSYNQSHQFNTTCTAGVGTVDEVMLQFMNDHNVSYDELNKDGDTYYYGLHNVSANTYSLCWIANDTLGNDNYEKCVADKWDYVVNKADVVINFSINDTSPKNYPKDLALNCNTSNIGVILSLYKNDTLLKTSNRADIGVIANITYEFIGNLSAGVYNFSCRSEQTHQNYTDSRNFSIFTLDKKNTLCTVSFAQAPVQLPDKVNATGNCSNPEIDWNMYREFTPGLGDFINATNESSINASITVAGIYEYIANSSETANYSKGEISQFLSILGLSGYPEANLILPNNNSVVNTSTVILNWSCYDPDENFINTTIYLSESLSNLSLSNITTYENVNASNDGNESLNYTIQDTKTYYWYINCTDMHGYYDDSDIWQFTVTQGKADNLSCTNDEECISGYCDNDGAWLPDDYICYTPYQTYFHDEPPATGGLDTCEFDVPTAESPYCDEREVGNGTTICDEFGETYFEDTCNSVCNLNDTYICRSSVFNSTCTAHSSCNGVANGTGACTAVCDYSTPYFSNPVNGSQNFKKYQNFTANITINSQSFGLNYTWFSTNNSGSWANDTPILLNGVLTYRFNNSKNISLNYPNVICWKVYANDSNNNLNVSDEYCFAVNDTAPTFNESLTTQTVELGNTLNYDINCSDADENTITYYDNSTLFDINESNGSIIDTPTQDEIGTYTINIICGDGTYNTSETFDYVIQDTTNPTISNFNAYALNSSKNLLGGSEWFNTGNLSQIEFMNITFTVEDIGNISGDISLFFTANGTNGCSLGNNQSSTCYIYPNFIKFKNGTSTTTFKDEGNNGDYISCSYTGNTTFRNYSCQIDEHYNPNVFKWYDAEYNFSDVKWQNGNDQKITKNNMIKVELNQSLLPLNADQYKLDFRANYTSAGTKPLEAYACNSTYTSGNPEITNICALVAVKNRNEFQDDGTKFRAIFTKQLIDELGDIAYIILKNQESNPTRYYYIKTYKALKSGYTTKWEYSSDSGTTWANLADEYESELNINWFYNGNNITELVLRIESNDLSDNIINSTDFNVTWNIDTNNNYPPLISIITPYYNDTLPSTFWINWTTVDPNDNNWTTNITLSDGTEITSNLPKSQSTYSYDSSGKNGWYNLTVISCENDTIDLYCTNDSNEIYINNTVAPTFSSPVNHSVDFKRYSNFTANITISDDINVNMSIFSTNASGSWSNYSAVAIGGLTSYRFNNSQNITIGYPNKVCWKVYANDSNGNVNVSDTYCFDVADTPTTFTNPVNASIDFKRYSNFTANITINDNDNLNYTIFSTNASGSWSNYSAVAIGGLTSYDFNNSQNITIGYPNKVCWRIFANDSAGTMTASDEYCFDVVAEPTVEEGGVVGDGNILETRYARIWWDYLNSNTINIFVDAITSKNSTLYHTVNFGDLIDSPMKLNNSIFEAKIKGLKNNDVISLYIIQDIIRIPQIGHEVIYFTSPIVQVQKKLNEINIQNFVYLIEIMLLVLIMEFSIYIMPKKQKL